MSKRVWAAAAAATGIVLAAVGVSTLGPATAADPAERGWARVLNGSTESSAQPISSGQVIELVSELNQDQDVDVAPPGFSAGDYFVFEETLRNRATNHEVGRDSVKCTVLFTTFYCEGTFLLYGRGQVEVAGAFGRFGNRIGVTGGTNFFQNVRGQLIVGAESGGRTNLTLHLIP